MAELLNRSTIACLFTALLLIGSRAALAQPPSLTVSGNPALLRINAAVAGSEPTSVSDATTTYRVRVSSSLNKKITGQLNAPMPAGVTLTITLAPPAGATSLGAIALDATARDLVVNISGVNSTQGITYQLSATVAAGVVANSSRIVTLTLVNYP